MGKPRLIIVIRHAQSEGNKNREIHQMIPDHRVKLTDEGWRQAEETGRRLRSLLKPDDTLQFFTSPYRRTRETTEGILSSLTSSGPNEAPSPFSRHAIQVYEEPRLREQDFGNFQPCSAEMERMWQERADYGHFFYRIPNGESAADAYDRVSGFNESLWRSFGDDEFPSVCVLVTHGLMTRVFLMKWYHWSVEYFEDLRNVNHCELVLMERNKDNGKYVMQNQLRTWSELRKQKAAEAAAEGKHETAKASLQPSPAIPAQRWGGCINGCSHDHSQYPRRARRPIVKDVSLPGPAVKTAKNEAEAHASAAQESTPSISVNGTSSADAPRNASTSTAKPESVFKLPIRPHIAHLNPGRDFGGSESGAATPADGLSEEGASDGDYFQHSTGPDTKLTASPVRLEGRSLAKALRRAPRRQPTEEDIENWAKQSGMGVGARADALGDEPADDEYDDGEGIEGIEGDIEHEDPLEKAERSDRSVRGSVY